MGSTVKWKEQREEKSEFLDRTIEITQYEQQREKKTEQMNVSVPQGIMVL